ncbi:MAG TPA: capsule assembly Wzi family protein [Rhizomicrobium sp.]
MASPWAEVGDGQLRTDIELLAAAGVIDGVTTHWPLPWKSLVQALARHSLAGQPLAVQDAARRVLDKAQAENAPGLSASVSADATNRTSVVYGFDGMGRGEGQGQLSLAMNGDLFSGRIALGGITQNFRGNTTKLMPEGTYFSASLGGALVYAGYLDHWWGPGEISALSLSNNARPMPQVGIERSETSASSWPVLRWLGPWQAEFLLGYLDGPRIQPDTYYSAARLTIHPLSGFEAAISRTEEFCGEGHNCVPIRDYFQFSNNPDSTNHTNDQLTFDFKYSHTLAGVPFQAYMQLMNEDYSWFNHSGTSHLFGTSIFLPTPGNPVKLTVEYTNSIATHHPFSFGDDIPGFSYTNYSYVDGMRYRGRTLGFSLDDDSTLLSVQGSWTDAAGRFYELSLHHATIATSQTPAGNNILTTAPVLLNMGEARISLPLALGGHGLKLDLAGRLQDDQPRPRSGFAASIETALRIEL